ncbi:hypothetical protein AA14337_3124 [Acetobacter malorum DSM 14337]|uniref:Carrier domain-containing protein n=1 Tax=Acetobacter malorum DSM 14337 TaxID=1307910 RepID=A0ABQ0PZT4_9PROT|nr:phosphopantetheine-binding protein [Acetobacter malorum]KXV05703.1 hypothetical protein AD930_11265 [Acetobacter malorum]GBQ85637.1 hypothetical protein AA14337_3124 [Acetobacter malorum DSM 14337]
MIDVARQVMRIIAEETSRKEESISRESSLSNDLGMNSDALLDLGFSLEDHFGIDITLADSARVLIALSTVQDVIDLIVQKTAP